MTLVLNEDDESHRHRTTPDLAEGDGSAIVAVNMEQYDDNDEADRQRVLSNWQVLRFISGFWKRRRWRVIATIVVGLIAIAFETYTPTAAKGLVDLASKPPPPGDVVWLAWGWYVLSIAANGLVRNLGFMWFWNPMAAENMAEITNEWFQRVQSLLRRLARRQLRRRHRAAHLARDVGLRRGLRRGDRLDRPGADRAGRLSVSLMLRWPMVGVFSVAMVAVYIAVYNVTLASTYVQPGPTASRWRSIRASAARWRTPSARNPAVKSFGAEAREEARFAQRDPRLAQGARIITWNRFTVVWLVQNLLHGGAAGGPHRADRAGRGSASKAGPGDVAFAITSFIDHGRLPAQLRRQHPHAADGPRRHRGRRPLLPDAAAAWRDAADAGAVPAGCRRDRASSTSPSATSRPRQPLYDDFSLRHPRRASGSRWWVRRGRGSRRS